MFDMCTQLLMGPMQHDHTSSSRDNFVFVIAEAARNCEMSLLAGVHTHMLLSMFVESHGLLDWIHCA